MKMKKRTLNFAGVECRFKRWNIIGHVTEFALAARLTGTGWSTRRRRRHFISFSPAVNLSLTLLSDCRRTACLMSAICSCGVSEPHVDVAGSLSGRLSIDGMSVSVAVFWSLSAFRLSASPTALLFSAIGLVLRTELNCERGQCEIAGFVVRLNVGAV